MQASGPRQVPARLMTSGNGRGVTYLHKGKVPDFRGMPPGFWELISHYSVFEDKKEIPGNDYSNRQIDHFNRPGTRLGSRTT
jgi:hypothetical protein